MRIGFLVIFTEVHLEVICDEDLEADLQRASHDSQLMTTVTAWHATEKPEVSKRQPAINGQQC